MWAEVMTQLPGLTRNSLSHAFLHAVPSFTRSVSMNRISSESLFRERQSPCQSGFEQSSHPIQDTQVALNACLMSKRIRDRCSVPPLSSLQQGLSLTPAVPSLSEGVGGKWFGGLGGQKKNRGMGMTSHMSHSPLLWEWCRTSLLQWKFPQLVALKV